MSFLVGIAVKVYSFLLEPVAPFTWFGLNFTTLDVVAAFRLCLILRQIREDLFRKHVKINGHTAVETRSFVRSASTALTVVYGGEALTCPYLLTPPSFMISGTVPIFYTVIQGIVDAVPSVPEMFFEMELPLSIVDGFTRAFLLCDLIPPAVTLNSYSAVANSPWALLMTSLIVTNGGFLITNLFSLHNPTSLALQTPPELLAYGWMTADIWSAPLITGLYALLTHAQPFWAESHVYLAELLSLGGKQVQPVDPETARALCAILLAGMFSSRTVKNFRLANYFERSTGPVGKKLAQEPKLKTQ